MQGVAAQPQYLLRHPHDVSAHLWNMMGVMWPSSTSLQAATPCTAACQARG